MPEILPNKINSFEVVPKDTLKTFWFLFEEFNKTEILSCEIDIVVTDIGSNQHTYQFLHIDSSKIGSTHLDGKRVEDIVAIAIEHGKENIQFGVLFKK